MDDIKLIVQNNPKSPISETYRAIRTNIQFAGAGKHLKYIAFTSSVPGEGKSTTISNIALTMAQDEKKVLLIDNDLRSLGSIKSSVSSIKGSPTSSPWASPLTKSSIKTYFQTLMS